MEKYIKVGNQNIKFKATALTPRNYRSKFQRDIISDMQKLTKAFTSGVTLDVVDLTIFENVAYIMCKQANPDIPDEPDEWLDTFDIFSIYDILPEIINLWGLNLVNIDESKKK